MQTVQRAEFWGAIVALQAYWPSHLGIDNLDVARTIGRLLDRGYLAKPLPLVKGDLVALVRCMIRTGGWETVRVTKVKGHAEDVDVQQGRVRLEDQLGVTLRLMLQLTWVVVISLKISLMLGEGYSRLVVIGSLLCLNCIGLWLLLLGLLSIMMEEAVLLLIPLFGIRVVGGRCAGLIWLMLIWLFSLAHLVSWVGTGFKFMGVVLFLVLKLLPGLTVLAFSVNLLHFWGLYIGQWVLRILVISAFLSQNFLSFLSTGLDIGCSVKR